MATKRESKTQAMVATKRRVWDSGSPAEHAPAAPSVPGGPDTWPHLAKLRASLPDVTAPHSASTSATDQAGSSADSRSGPQNGARGAAPRQLRQITRVCSRAESDCRVMGAACRSKKRRASGRAESRAVRLANSSSTNLSNACALMTAGVQVLPAANGPTDLVFSAASTVQRLALRRGDTGCADTPPGSADLDVDAALSASAVCPSGACPTSRTCSLPAFMYSESSLQPPPTVTR